MTQGLRWVRENMPEECVKALATFVRCNPGWNGAGWDDCLDILIDSDSHLELTEPMWVAFDEMDPPYRVMPPVCEIAVTLLYANGVPPSVADVLAVLERVG
jgi:hypothetical protein